MVRHSLIKVTLIPSNVDATQGASLHVAMQREYAEEDASDPSGEAIYARDQVDAQIADPAIIEQARALLIAIAQHYADNVKVTVKRSPSRSIPLIEPTAAAPRAVR